jgi:hypothetical protein
MSGKCLCPVFERLIVISILLIVSNPLFAQHIITGRITGKEGIPLSGTSLSVKGSKTSAITDSGGRFTISADPGSIIDISFVGYVNRQVKIGSETELNISLSESIVNLDEVMLVGYGTSRRKDITGAVSRIT